MVMNLVSLWIASLAMHNKIPHHQPYSEASLSSVATTTPLGRRDFGRLSLTTATSTTATAAFVVLGASCSFPLPSAWAFDGSGASASSGYNPATKAEKVRGWKKRIVADVHDFNQLGAALSQAETGVDITKTKAWINFFIPFQRREPDEYGRAYAALVDLRGIPTKKKYEYEGGDGLLLATSFTKPGKPSENTPAVKAWNQLFKTFDAIEAAGTGKGGGDVKKARAAWEATKPLLEQYLASVELPGNLNDPTYN